MTYNCFFVLLLILTAACQFVACQSTIARYRIDKIPVTTLSSANYMVLDVNGDLIISDTGASNIRKVSTATNASSIIVGTGNSTYNGDGLQALNSNILPTSIALSPKTGELYFADQNKIVRKVNNSTGAVEFVVGNLKNYNQDGIEAKYAYMDTPHSVLPLNNGEVIIVEGTRIRKIQQNGKLLTLAGNVDSSSSQQALRTSFSTMSAFANPDTGDVYFLDYQSNRLRKYDNATQTISDLLSNVYLFSYNPSNKLFAIFQNWNVYTYSIGGSKRLIAGTGINSYSPDNNNATGNPMGDVSSIAVANDGSVYITENAIIRNINPVNNSLTTVAGKYSLYGYSAADGSVAKAASITPTSIHFCHITSQIYFVELYKTIRKITSDGKLKTMAGIQYGDSGPFFISKSPKSLGSVFNLGFNSVGDIYIGQIILNRASVFRLSTNTLEVLVTGQGDGGQPNQVTFGIDIVGLGFTQTNDLFISAYNLRKMSASGQISSESSETSDRMFVSEIDNSVFYGVYGFSIYNIGKDSILLKAGGGDGNAADGRDAVGADLYMIGTSNLIQIPNGEVYFQYYQGCIRKIKDGKLWTVAGICGDSTRYSMTQTSYSDSLNVNFDTISGLTFDKRNGKFYFIAGSTKLFAMTPYCPTGYAFGDIYRTTCVPICYGVSNQSTVCSGNGNCTAPNTCVCNGLFTGVDCSTSFCDTATGKSNSLLCPSQMSTNTSSLSTVSSTVQTVSNLQTLNNKTVTFTNVVNIKIELPSSISSYLSTQVVNETIQLVSVLSKENNPISQTLSSDNSTTVTTVLTSVVTLVFIKANDGQSVSVKNLTKPISFTFSNITSTKSENSTLQCCYFDELSNSWKSDGLETQINYLPSLDSSIIRFTATCKTYHLTSFAVIDQNVKASLKVNNQQIIVDVNDTTLIVAIVVSVVGGLCVIGVVAVIIAVVCILIRRRKQNK